MKPKYLAELKAAGVNWLALGIESKSKFVRDGVAKGRFNDEDIYRIVQEIKDAGIHVIGNYIFGLPDDNFQTMNETLNMALEMNCEMANFYSAMAYPGSQLFDMAIKDGIALPESWLGYSQHAFESLPLATKHISAGEVLAFRDRAGPSTSPTRGIWHWSRRSSASIPCSISRRWQPGRCRESTLPRSISPVCAAIP